MNNSRKRKWFYKKQSVVPDWYEELESRYIELLDKKLALEEEIQDFREELLEWMREDKCNRIETSKTNTVIVREHKCLRVDSDKLKREHPKLFLNYSKQYTMPEHLQITIKRD